ncbi:Homoserine O-acetyltransferase [Corynebacterium pseudotuberculosis]|nr:Homoserine O-acetyltransferase [Corynebacterium pseudotuberculosis 3/99-5]AIG06822.1 Homoserine O-acetyltransferase [Corynebacterium pseudotuberculosis]AIG08596.1 Homoserine O-acetyltransferase [Corynebacterium pseudotuberculosis]AIG10488.1 Homoserine O-acetyltransferase [Corynebacterium pseudotuberculosis]
MLKTTGELTIVPIGDFRTEAGIMIPDVVIAYQAWGTFRGDNLVIVERALTGDSNAISWWNGLIGDGLALDTRRYCVLCTNALGGCMGSTGPSTLHPDARP